MNQPPIENLMKNTMEQLKAMIDVDTIVGDAVCLPNNGVAIPISRVSFGFFAGGGEYGVKEPAKQGTAQGSVQSSANAGYPFAGGAGAGVSLNPQAFLVVTDQVRLIPVQCDNPYERALDILPNVLAEIQKWMEKKAARDKNKNMPECENGEVPPLV